MSLVYIRPPSRFETPLSNDEKWVAIRENIHAIDDSRWHPDLVSNWSCASARMNRKLAVDALEGLPLNTSHAPAREPNEGASA